MKFINKKGDTIVEVMIAIVILGAVLGGAFAISNKSQQNAQANHERYQAQLLANQQAELLRQAYAAYINSGTRAGFDSTFGNLVFCLGQPSSCTNGIYTIAVQRVPDANTGSAGAPSLTYNIKVSWDGLNGQRQNLDLVYGL